MVRLRSALIVFVMTAAVLPLGAEEVSEEFVRLVFSGDVDALSAYVEEHADFSRAVVRDPALGEVGVGILATYLPYTGTGGDLSDEHLFDSGETLFDRVIERNGRMARFLFEHGADPSMESPVFSDEGDRYEIVGVFTPEEAARRRGHDGVAGLLAGR